MELAAILVAGYAAVVATGSLAWQVYSWRHRRSSHVVVTTSMAVIGLDEPLHVVSVRATNHSEHPVRVTGVGLDLQDGSGYQFHQVRPVVGATLPGLIPAHDSAEAFLLQDAVEEQGIDVHEPVTAWVRLATGEHVRSEPARLLSRS